MLQRAGMVRIGRGNPFPRPFHLPIAPTGIIDKGVSPIKTLTNLATVLAVPLPWYSKVSVLPVPERELSVLAVPFSGNHGADNIIGTGSTFLRRIERERQSGPRGPWNDEAVSDGSSQA